MNEDTSGNSDSFQRMLTQMSGSAGHGDGHHVIPPYRLASYSLSSGFPVNAPVLPPTSATRHVLQPQAQAQQGHWMLSNTDPQQGTAAQSQHQQSQTQPQQQSNAHFQRLKVEDALSYLDKVKAQFVGQPQVYNDFLDIMKEFKSQAIDTPVVISRVSQLFAGQKELIVGFNTFLPPGFKIIEESSSQTLNLCQPGHQAVPLASLGTVSGNPAFRSSEPSVVHPVPSAVVPLAQQHQNHLGPQPGQPVEFNHAINYVNKIKMCYHGRPEIYKAFLDILHNYQKEQKNIKESCKSHHRSAVTEADVYAQVASLFQDNPELLLEFRQFLPDANGSGASFINGLGAAESALRGSGGGVVGGGGGPMLVAAASGISGELSRTAAEHSSAKGFNPVSHRSHSLSSSCSITHSKKRKPSKEPVAVVVPIKREAILSDREYFDQLKRTTANDPLYREMFKCIDLYNAGSISSEDLFDMTGPLTGKTPELKSRLISMVESDRRATAEKKDKDLQWHLDLSSCKRFEDQPSYRILPKKKLNGKSDSKAITDPKDPISVLNDEYAVMADPNAKREATIWHCAKLSAYDEVVLQTEDERYELDMIIQPHYDVMHSLSEMHKMLQKMTADEQARFQMNELSSSCHLAEIHIQKVLKKLYNNKWDTVYDGLKKIPTVALGLVLNRMQEKCTEWEDSKKKFNQSWQETCLKQRIRWLEQQGSKFKNTDGKQFKPKTLIKEIEDLARARESLVDEPLLTLSVQDVEIIKDAAELITLVSKRQSGISSEETTRLKWILKSLVEDFFHIQCVKEKQEIKDLDDESDSNKDTHTSPGKQSGTISSSDSAQYQSSVAVQEEETVTAFYCSDNWYVLFRIFVVLCDRLAFFVKHAEELVDDDRKDFSQAWPSSVSTALEQHMQEHGHMRRSYATFFWLTKNLLNGVIDLGLFEELIRETFGLEAFGAFTLDKLVQSIVRHILQIIASSNCVDLLKLFERHKKTARQWDSKYLDEYLSEARSLVSNDENFYLVKTLKKWNKGRMTFWLLPKAETNTERLNPEEAPTSKPSKPASPVKEEQSSSCQTVSENVTSYMEHEFPDFDAAGSFGLNDLLSKSVPTILWSSAASSVPKSPLFIRRNLIKTDKHELRSNPIEGIKETGENMDLEEEEYVEEEGKLYAMRILMEKFNDKSFLLMKLTSLEKAKQTHLQLSQRKTGRFCSWLNAWKTKHISEKEEEDCLAWFMGKLEEMNRETVCCIIGDNHRTPYHAYRKYSLRRKDDDSGAVVK